MSGGEAFVHDPDGDFASRCNLEMVALEELADYDDRAKVKDLLLEHVGCTDSSVAQDLLDHWETAVDRFVKVMPVDYKRVLSQQRAKAEAAAASAAMAGA
jgi:glutamate synthase (ferredoxin)